MFRCTTTAAVAIASALLYVQTADAQTYRNMRYTNCRDAAGVRVVAYNTTRLRNVGMAGRVRGRPVILFNPVVLSRFQPATRTFWYYHECAHHALGHSLGHRPVSRERDADCWAIRQMKARGLLSAARLRTIQRDLYPLNGDGHIYLPGPQRAAHVGFCATGRRTLPRMVRQPGYRQPTRRQTLPYAGQRPARINRYGSEQPVPRYRPRYNYSPEQANRQPMARYTDRRRVSPAGGTR
ncbi:MAG: hypothetical protein RLT05_14040 [Bauldia litoralis]